MRWPWRRGGWQTPRDTEGIEYSKQVLARAQADEVRVAAIAEAHRRKREENHFGPRIAAALREGHR